MGRYNYTSLRYVEAIEREVRMNSLALEELSKWYSLIPWNFYCHFTTMDDISESDKYTEYWQKIVSPSVKIPDDLVLIFFKRLVRQINIDLYGKKYREKGLGISWVIGIEDVYGRHKHIHAVMYGEGLYKYHRNCIRGKWEEVGLRTGISRVEQYDWQKYNEKGLFYMVKHQIKHNKVFCFIQKRHNLYFMKGNPYWWKENPEVLKKDFNTSHSRSVGSIDLFEGFVCFGYCKRLHQRIVEKSIV